MAVAFFAGWMTTPSAIRDGGSRAVAADHPKPNACGCYRDSAGACFCGKKGACNCPGECEPKGCDEKRGKQIDKEIAAETKKAQAAARSGNAMKEKPTPESDDDGKAKGKEKVVHLSAAQKKELAKLLDAYLAEHPEAKSQTIGEVKAAVAK